MNSGVLSSAMKTGGTIDESCKQKLFAFKYLFVHNRTKWFSEIFHTCVYVLPCKISNISVDILFSIEMSIHITNITKLCQSKFNNMKYMFMKYILM